VGWDHQVGLDELVERHREKVRIGAVERVI
jgi:hypothetical protein